MIADLKPYAEYKESGLPWLGQMPQQWQTRRLKYLARFRSGEGITSQQIESAGPFPVYGGNGIRGYTTRYTHDGSYALIGRQGALCGNINFARGQFFASEHAVVPTISSGLSMLWFGELLRVMNLNQYSQSAAQPGLSVERIKNLYAPVPPNSEQEAIVRFLSWANGRLERAIRAKRKVIALLNEQKQAIIHRAVTGGLDPSVPLKPSGIPWLGDIPQHWETRRLKSLLATRITDGPHATPTFHDTGVPFLSVDGIQDGELTFENCRHVTVDDHAEFIKKTQPRKDDILLGKAASTGKIARVKVAFPFSIWSPLALIRPNQTVVSAGYLEHLLKDISAQTQIEWLCTSNTQRNISMDDIPKLILLVPPLAEQQPIMNYLDSRLSGITAAIQRLRHETNLVREYRTRLVADVVTGKLDVREAAARLPEEVATDTVEDDAGLSDETEPVDEEAGEGGRLPTAD